MIYLLAGKVASGKSTAIIKIADMLGRKRCAGLLSEELMEDGQRRGFFSKGIHCKEEIILAHKDFVLKDHVEDFGVDLASFDKLCQKEFDRIYDSAVRFILIDEIGRMQLMSDVFREYLNKIADGSKPLIATICFDEDIDYIKAFKQKEKVKLYVLDEDNRNKLPWKIVKDLTKEDVLYQNKLSLAEKYASLEKRYQFEKDGVILRSDHGIRTIVKKDIYYCDCDYYKENGVCSHILSLLLIKERKHDLWQT